MVGLGIDSTNPSSIQNLANGDIPLPNAIPNGAANEEIPRLVELARVHEIHTRNMDLVKEAINNILSFIIRLTSDWSGSPVPDFLALGIDAPDDRPQINKFHHQPEASVPGSSLFGRKFM